MSKPDINSDEIDEELKVDESERDEKPQEKENKSTKEDRELSIEEKLAYQKIRNKITKWKNSFPKETKDFKIKNDMNYDDLVDLEKQIEYSVGTANAGSVIQSTILGATTIIENKGPSIGFQLNGYSSVLMTNENFRKIMLELECIHGGGYSSPYYRLLTTMLYTASIVHLSNKQKIEAKMEDSISKEKTDKYNKL